MTRYDTAINHGRFFDGSKHAHGIQHIALHEGKVAEIRSTPFTNDEADTVIDASDRWVMPGFIDAHTHYDGELLIAPSLSESVRHGVTTVMIGNCSISTILSSAEDCSDIFTRVESVPREYILPALKEKKTWNTPAEYREALGQLGLGPNVAAFLGHSDLRIHVLGIDNAVNRAYQPTDTEMAAMTQHLEDAIDAGFLGLSAMTTTWDKLDGDRLRSASLPSTYAKLKEFRLLNRVLRRRNRIHQGAPNIVTKYNIFFFLEQSMGLFRKPLKTTLISLMDLKASRFLYGAVSALTHVINRVFRANFRWQSLPNPFGVYADGMDLVIFEEFGSGQAALHLTDELQRNNLLKDESYRRWFRKDYENTWGPRVWQRDFHDTKIVQCPDKNLVGRSFGDIANERQLHPADTFLDLVCEFGQQLRWHTIVANGRPDVLKKLVKNQALLITFADSGAHIRNMAYYNFPLRLLKLVNTSHEEGKPIMSLEEAVWRLTGEQADWFGLETGYLRKGDRADLTIINPAKLDQPLDDFHEDTMEGFGDTLRIVNRNPGVVEHVFINGKHAVDEEQLHPDLGTSTAFGQFLPAQTLTAKESDND